VPTQPPEESRVLLVGDDEPELKACALALDAAGCLVEFATNVDAARALLEQQGFDAILLDFDTTGLAGTRFLEHARSRSQNLALLLLTQGSAAATATDLDAPKRLVKPVEPRALVQTMAEVLRLRQVEEANRIALGADGAARVRQERAEQRAAGAEAAEQRVASTLQAVMECAPAFIIAVDTQGRIKFINRVMAHHAVENVIGSDWLSYMPPSEHDQHSARLRRILSTGAFETYETIISGPGGQNLWFSAHMGPMRQGDAIVGAVLVSQDVTELKRTQADWAGAQRLAALGTLAAGIAHEINTPVQFVSDSVHFLRGATTSTFALLESLQTVRRLAEKGAPAAELSAALAAVASAEEDADLDYVLDNVPKALALCAEGLARVKDIVRSMKEFAHPAQDEMTAVDLNRAIESTITIARHEYKYVAEVETELSELPAVTCYVSEINQVLLNLLVNAAHAISDVVKEGDEKGRITVKTRREGANVVIAISDTGTGIPDAIAHRIFEPFFTTKEVGKGTGQGLSLAWASIREKHGGELRFTSKLGEGTTFFIELPIAGKQAKQASSQNATRLV
jgi:PAS domain S-box-containing protein